MAFGLKELMLLWLRDRWVSKQIISIGVEWLKTNEDAPAEEGRRYLHIWRSQGKEAMLKKQLLDSDDWDLNDDQAGIPQLEWMLLWFP